MLAALLGSRMPKRYERFFDLPERIPSTCLPAPEDTRLAQAVARYLGDVSCGSGVYRLDHGLPALGIRLGLIEHARVAVDIQSYLLRDDVAGNLVALALLDAAERGVRVRLLMDDALTEPVDAGLIALNRHPNVEVRVFNPFPRRRSRLVSFIANFNILNRRMHNKSMTVDSLVSIVGGRNIADEYYQVGGQLEFVDEDLLAIGPVVNDVDEEFDRYWNTREAIPIALYDTPDATLDAESLAAEGHQFLERHRGHQLLECRQSDITDRLLATDLPMTFADVRLVVDHPDKVRRVGRRAGSKTMNFLQTMVTAAEREVLIVSPYFVPQRQGVDFLSSLVRRGVRVVVVTNSLASTNHKSVHAAYARYRRPLLKAGVELHELTPGRRRFVRPEGGEAATQLTLHSKIAVTDREQAFVGSFNLDPRSLYLNTEMGLAVRDPGFATTMALSILDSLPVFTYRLQLHEGRSLRWRYRSDSERSDFDTEPDTTLWQRISNRLMAYLPIEGQM